MIGRFYYLPRRAGIVFVLENAPRPPNQPTKFRDELFSLTNSVPGLLNYPPCTTSPIPPHTPAAINTDDTTPHRAASASENDLPNSLARKSKPAHSESSAKHRKAGDAKTPFSRRPGKILRISRLSFTFRTTLVSAFPEMRRFLPARRSPSRSGSSLLLCSRRPSPYPDRSARRRRACQSQ
jgi:hypothetical protein